LFQTNDLLTHVDHLKLFSGSLQDFLDSGVKETVVPIIDDEDNKFGGSRLLGFVLIQAIVPRKLHLRRGDVEYDMEEGGPAPMISVGNVMIGKNGEINANADEYVPPPVGGGKCISSRDCYHFNGTCSQSGECLCRQNRTGSYCQLVLTQATGIAGMISEQKVKGMRRQTTGAATPAVESKLPKPPPEVDTFVKVDSETKPKSSPFRLERKPAEGATPAAADEPPSDPGEDPAAGGAEQPLTGKKGKGVIRKKKPGPKGKPQPEDSPAESSSGPQGSSPGAKDPPREAPAEETAESKMKTLYGPNGVYPEPFLAGKIPGNMALQRAKLRSQPGPPFVYSIRYRAGPIGIAFDNKQAAASIVEGVMPNLQSAISDVQKGDRLIAINEINTTTAPAKVVTRILQSLPWPIVLVFQCPPPKIDPKKLEAESASKRTVNMTIIYPPTMLGEYEVRLADWTPPLHLYHEDTCTVYSMRTPADVFGCKIEPGECAVSSETNEIISRHGKVSESLEKYSPMQVLLSQEATRGGLGIKMKSISLVKRGTCTFVEKAKGIVTSGADVGVVINTEDALLDIPAGKENITACTAPYGVMKSLSGELLHIVALQSEVLVLFSDPLHGRSPACSTLQVLSEDLLDKWAHSVPPVPTQRVLSAPPPRKDNLRGKVDEGGRIAISGQNGWAFFDYHLALFGPQEVPLGPLRLQMAMPPHGTPPSPASASPFPPPPPQAATPQPTQSASRALWWRSSEAVAAPSESKSSMRRSLAPRQ
jgi:hypothetical protein